MTTSDTAPRPNQLVCPKCGGDQITSYESGATTAYYGVRFFSNPDEDPNYGAVIVDYDAVWDTKTCDGDEYENDLECRACGARPAELELVPAGTAPDPTWEPTRVGPDAGEQEYRVMYRHAGKPEPAIEFARASDIDYVARALQTLQQGHIWEAWVERRPMPPAWERFEVAGR